MTNTDPMTIAYIAKGVGLFVADPKNTHYDPDVFGGEIGLMNSCIEQATMLDNMVASLKDSWNGVFVYDVAEPFGEQYAAALARGDDHPLTAFNIAKKLIGASEVPCPVCEGGFMIDDRVIDGKQFTVCKACGNRDVA